MKRAIVIALIFVFLSVSLIFAQSAYDQYFDKGKELFNDGNFAEAAAQFKIAAEENTDFIDPWINMGICYGKINELDKSIGAFKQAQALFPDDWQAPYWLATIYNYKGEIGKALKSYQRAKELGITGQDNLGQELAQYQPKESDIEYEPVFDKANSKVNIRIKGNSGADKELILDTLRQLEKMESLEKRGIFTQVDVELIGWEKGQTWIKEKWTVSRPEGIKDYWIKFDFKPPADFPAKIMVIVSDHDE